MKTQEANTIIDQQLDSLASALDAGKSQAMMRFLHTMAKFHKYSLGNVLLIMGQYPAATRIAGFQTWKSLGRHVKKGEKGIAILAPIQIKMSGSDTSIDATKEQGDEYIEGEESSESGTILRFRVVYVFDVDQTEGDDLPDFAQVAGEPGAYTDQLKHLVNQHGITIEYEESLGGPDGLSKKGTIVIRQGLAPATEFSVIVHEFAHELMHQNDRRENMTRTVIETEAEAVAYVVSQAIGLESGTAASDYIQLYRGNKELLNQSLTAIKSTAHMILSALFYNKRERQ